MRKSALKILALATATLLLVTGPALAKTLAIKGGAVHTMGEQGVLENATVIIKDGRITAVGRDVTIPAGAEVIDAAGKVVTPGAMHSGSLLGLSEISLTKDSNEHSAKESPFSAAFDVRYGLDADSVVIADNRRQGLTHAISQPSGADGIFAGSGAVVSLTGGADMIFAKGPMVAYLEDSGNRNVAWAKLRLIFDQVKFYDSNRSRIRKGEGPDDFLLSAYNMEALAPVVKGRQKLVLVLNSANDIRQAIAFKRDTGADLILSGAAEAWKVADELARAQMPVIIDAQENLPDNFGKTGATLRNAARLDAAGVLFAISSGNSNHNAYMVNQMAGIAVAHGLKWQSALAAITLNPARIFGIDKDFGSLEKGKVANIVVWDGDPLEITSNATHVLVNGVNHPLVSRRTLLRDRYLDLNRKPFAFH